MKYAKRIAAAAVFTIAALGGCEPGHEDPECETVGCEGDNSNPASGELTFEDLDDLREAIGQLQEDNIGLQEELALLAQGPKITYRQEISDIVMQPGDDAIVTVFCEEGEIAIGGGARTLGTSEYIRVLQTFPLGPQPGAIVSEEGAEVGGWGGHVMVVGSVINVTPYAYVICLAR